MSLTVAWLVPCIEQWLGNGALEKEAASVQWFWVMEVGFAFEPPSGAWDFVLLTTMVKVSRVA
jgi:hypothetical protein